MSVIVRYPFKIPFKFDFSGSFAAGRIVCGKREHYLNVTKNIAKQTALVRLCPFVPYSVMLTLSVAAVATVHKKPLCNYTAPDIIHSFGRVVNTLCMNVMLFETLL